MAKISEIKRRGKKYLRVRYTLHLSGGRSIRRDKYASTRKIATQLQGTLEEVEDAFRTGMAHLDDIEFWIQRGYIKEEEAAAGFRLYVQTREKEREIETDATDYETIYFEYDAYSRHNSDQGAIGNTHRANISRARKIRDWLQERVPNLEDITAGDVRAFLEDVRKGNLRNADGSKAKPGTRKTVALFSSVFKIFLDQAIKLNMLTHNPAREVSVPTPRVTKKRRILLPREIETVLEKSLLYTHRLRGCLPTVVRLGLYAGLRNSEMVWLPWDFVDFNENVLTIQEVESEVTKRVKKPKGARWRDIPMHQKLRDWLKEEKERQRRNKLIGQFVLCSHGNTPYDQRSLQDVFKTMILDEGLDEEITVYSMRHTFATLMLRKPPAGAGHDLETVRYLMGHEDVRTTQEYMHHVPPEDKPTDDLPY